VRYYKPMKPEAKFVDEMEAMAAFMGMRVEIVPDVQNITAENRKYNREKKRPFDFVLIAPDHVYCIEAKVAYNQQMEHQKVTMFLINLVRPCYFVVRKKTTKTKGTEYIIEQSKKVIKSFDTCEEMLEHFKKGV